MGSLSSRPNVPAQQPVVYYVPTYTPTTPTPTAPTDTGTETPTTPTDDDVKAQARASGLLERRRGVLSTVLTGFRGVLNQDNNTNSQRKTLLGE